MPCPHEYDLIDAPRHSRVNEGLIEHAVGASRYNHAVELTALKFVHGDGKRLTQGPNVVRCQLLFSALKVGQAANGLLIGFEPVTRP